jgi:hypothetical protein
MAACRGATSWPAGAGAGAQALSEALVKAALRSGSGDNLTAAVVRVQGALEGTLQDEARHALQRPVLPLLKVGDTVDGLEVLALVADSGIHRLYQVRDPLTQRRYALKSLHPSVRTTRRAPDPGSRGLGGAACRAAARRHLARLTTGRRRGCTASGFTCCTTGTTARPWGPCCSGGGCRCPGAEPGHPGLAHAGGAAPARVVHRDVKPDNLHLGEDGVLRLLDLGVALSGREPAATRELHAGTPSYMNPEQWAGHGQAGHKARCPMPAATCMRWA